MKFLPLLDDMISMNYLQTSMNVEDPEQRQAGDELQGLNQQFPQGQQLRRANIYNGTSTSQTTPYSMFKLPVSVLLILMVFSLINYYTDQNGQSITRERKRRAETQRADGLQQTGKRQIKGFQFVNDETRQTLGHSLKDDGFESDWDDTVQVASHQQKDAQLGKSSSQVYVQETYLFEIPKRLWLFNHLPTQYIQHLYLDNHRYYAKKHSYSLTFIDQQNYQQYVPIKQREDLTNIIFQLRQRVRNGLGGNLNSHIDNIIKQLILVNVLYAQGGIISSGQFAITEDLTWINTITANQYVNRGNRYIQPQIVGFYSPYYSPQKTKENIVPFKGMEEVDRYVNLFPALQPYFIAAQKNTPFLGELITKMYELLSNPNDFAKEEPLYSLHNLKGKDIYYQYFLLATQMVLQDRQKRMDGNKADDYRHFAIDYYGMSLINCYYGPYRLFSFWKDDQANKAFQSMTQYTSEEFLANIGPIRYIADITPTKDMNYFLEETKKASLKPIMHGSFIQKILFPDSKDLPFIVQNKEKAFVNASNEEWSSLPKIIWVFWDKGLSNAKVNNQICVQNLRRMAKVSGFTVHEVNLSNIHEYLREETIQKIETAISKSKLRTYPQTKGDLYRLALLDRYGGIYMDASYIALENFDWLVNIGRYPSEYIFNRYGHLPTVFMLWHPHYGSPHTWEINEKYSTKVQWHLAYENNFIAAQKQSELIKDWFSLLIGLYGKTYSEVEEVFRQCHIAYHKWTSPNSQYLLPMDAIKCVIGRRQVELSKGSPSEWGDASDYYRIWSMSGYLGQQKFRGNTNLENKGSDDHHFIYRYSQDYVEGLLGKVRHIAKFYSQNNQAMSAFIARHKDGNFTADVHPHSIFMNHMWRKSFVLEEIDFEVKLKSV